MDNTDAPIRMQEHQRELITVHDHTLRRQLHLSLIVVLVLLAATIGVMLSLSPAGDSSRHVSTYTSASRPG